MVGDVFESTRRSEIARAALLVAAITVLARLVGFLRVVVFAHTVGPTCLGDTYYTANTVPNILFDVVAGGALSSVVVPALAGAVDAGDARTADRTVSALLSWTVLVLLPVLALGLIFARPIMEVLTGNGHPGCVVAHEQAVGARMLLVFMPQVLVYGVGIVLAGTLQSHRRFLAPAIGPLVSSLVVVGAYLLFAAEATDRETSLSTLTRGHELILSLGTTLGVVALVVPLVWSLRSTGRRLRPTLRFPPGVAAMARRMAVAGAVVIGSQDLATAVVLRLANDRGTGGAVVLYNLAWSVFLLPWAVLAVPLATAAFPTLTARWQAGQREGFSTTVAATSRAVVVASAGAAAALVAVAHPAARVIVLGAPGGTDPEALARALVAFAPGVVGYGLVAHLSRVHYARGDARTPAMATAAGWLLVIAADLVLVSAMPRTWTAAALGLGTSIGMTLAAGWLAAVLVREREPLLGVRRTATTALGAAAVAAAVGYAVSRGLPQGGIAASLGLTVLDGAACLAVFVAAVAWLDRGTLSLLRGRRYAA